MRSAAVVLVALVACGGSKSRPETVPPSNVPAAEEKPVEPAPTPGVVATPSDAEFEVMMEQAVAMFEAMGAAADNAGADCGKLADGLDQVMNDNSAFIASAKKYKNNPDMDKRGEEWMKVHQDQVMGPMMKVAGAGQKCSTDAKFMAVMQRLSKIGN